MDSVWPSQAHLATNFAPKLFVTGPQDPNKTSKQSLRPSTARPRIVMQTPTTSTPKNQLTNPQAFGVGSAECAERSNPPQASVPAGACGKTFEVLCNRTSGSPGGRSPLLGSGTHASKNVDLNEDSSKTAVLPSRQGGGGSGRLGSAPERQKTSTSTRMGHSLPLNFTTLTQIGHVGCTRTAF